MLAKMDKRGELATGLEIDGSMQVGPTWKGGIWVLSAYVPGGHFLPHLDRFNHGYMVLGYFRNPVFWPYLKKIALKTRSGKYPKQKVEKQKMLKMLLCIICEAPKKINPFLSHFQPFLPYFT